MRIMSVLLVVQLIPYLLYSKPLSTLQTPIVVTTTNAVTVHKLLLIPVIISKLPLIHSKDDQSTQKPCGPNIAHPLNPSLTTTTPRSPPTINTFSPIYTLTTTTAMTITIRPATDADVPGIAAVSMAAFDPSTDVISRHLFPSALADNHEFHAWSINRKSARIHTPYTLMMVAVDDSITDAVDAVLGYSTWLQPAPPGEEHAPPNAPPAGVDADALAQLRQVMMEDEEATHSMNRPRKLWSTFLAASMVRIECTDLLQRWPRWVCGLISKAKGSAENC